MGRSICGNCSLFAASAAEVKACYGGDPDAHGNGYDEPPAQSRAQRRQAEVNRTEARFASGGDAAVPPPAAREPSQPEEWTLLTAGLYVHNGQTFMVKISKKHDLPYAMRRDPDGSYTYVPNSQKPLRLKNRVSDIPEGEDKVHDKAPAAFARTLTEEDSGMWRHPDSGEILKVYKAVHGSGNMCAKRLVMISAARHDPESGEVTEPAEVEFQYIGLATRFLTSHIKLTLDDAQQFGEIYGSCMNCGKTLTREESILLSIGSTCILNYPDGKERLRAAKAAVRAKAKAELKAAGK